MNSQAISSKATSGSPDKGNITSSMLGPFIYDTSPLADGLIQRAMAATTIATTAATTTMPATKDKPSNDIDVKNLEGSGQATVKL